MTEPLKPQWIVVDRKVLIELLDAAMLDAADEVDEDLWRAIARITDDVEFGRCTLLTKARWNGDSE